VHFKSKYTMPKVQKKFRKMQYNYIAVHLKSKYTMPKVKKKFRKTIFTKIY